MARRAAWAEYFQKTSWAKLWERAKNLRLCRVDAFENPQFSVGASRPGFGSHCAPKGVGLQAPEIESWLPRVLHRFVKSAV